MLNIFQGVKENPGLEEKKNKNREEALRGENEVIVSLWVGLSLVSINLIKCFIKKTCNVPNYIKIPSHLICE